MSLAATVLFLSNYALIGILPKIFFKQDGRFNLMWWITAAPLFLNSIVILLNYLGYLHTQWQFPLFISEGLSVVISVLSIFIISMTMGTHRIPLALWHQKNDAPAQIVTWGAYKYVRHPFYTSFLTAQIGSILFCPHYLNIVGLVAGFLILNITAAKEEKKLSASAFGKEYIDYKNSNGRFFPRLF